MSSLRRSLREFLLVPAVVVVGFLALAALTDYLDHSDANWLQTARESISRHVFGKTDRTSDVLGAIATGIVTMTSITVSVLLVALQQSSTNLTAQVFDQFVRRRQNQLFFGGFIGLAIYALLVLASITDHFNPVFGATTALLLTVAALVAMVALLYAVVNEMRPVEIITVIHDLALRARGRQRRLLERTRRRRRLVSVPCEVRATANGFVTHVDVEALDRVATKVDGEVELVVSLGSYVAMDDVIANVRGASIPQDGVDDAVRRAVDIERHRELDFDASFAVEQLQTIGWTAISSAKHSRQAGLLCIRSTFDVLARWSGEPPERPDKLAVVYRDDTPRHVFETIEAFGVASSEAVQSRCFAEILVAIARVYARLSRNYRLEMDRSLDVLLRLVPEIPFTRALEDALEHLTRVLFATGSAELGTAVDRAHAEKRRRRGREARWIDVMQHEPPRVPS